MVLRDRYLWYIKAIAKADAYTPALQAALGAETVLTNGSP